MVLCPIDSCIGRVIGIIEVLLRCWSPPDTALNAQGLLRTFAAASRLLKCSHKLLGCSELRESSTCSLPTCRSEHGVHRMRTVSAILDADSLISALQRPEPVSCVEKSPQCAFCKTQEKDTWNTCPELLETQLKKRVSTATGYSTQAVHYRRPLCRICRSGR